MPEPIPTKPGHRLVGIDQHGVPMYQMTCANCGKPLPDHCREHLIPCCPGTHNDGSAGDPKEGLL